MESGGMELFEEKAINIRWEEPNTIGEDCCLVETDLCISTPGAYCGAKIISSIDACGKSTLYFISPEDGQLIELTEELELEFSPCEVVSDLINCEYETIIIPVCADTEDDLIHTEADILGLIEGSNAVFNISGEIVDLTSENQTLVYAKVQSYFCDTIVKKPDGTNFNVFNPNACVSNESGVVIFQLQQGGNLLLGGTRESLDMPVQIAETITWPCGSAGIYTLTIKNIIEPQKTNL
jgi:hypothetical protein